MFEKGTGVIEKTYSRERHMSGYEVNAELADKKETRKNLKNFKKRASRSGGKNLIISGIEGVGLGFLGIGIPDIPLFTAMILKSMMRQPCITAMIMKRKRKVFHTEDHRDIFKLRGCS